VELLSPKKALEEAGATVHVISPEPDAIRGWDQTEWGESVPVDRTLDQAQVEEYDALVLPGGQINPDKLRTVEAAVDFVKRFAESHKPLAAICHAPWLLIEADLVRDRSMTSYPSIRTDMKNAGADWVDEEVVVDGNFITSRNPSDLDAFNETLISALAADSAGRKVA
jgi:protease I